MDYMSTLGNKEIMAQNIRYYLKKYGKTQKEICKDLGFKEMTFSDWVNAKTYPRIDKIEKIANYFHVQKADLVEEKRKPLKNIVPIERCMVPIIGQIAAGKPILADEHIEAFLPCDTGVHADFGLVVSGDSMIGADIHDGDVVFIRRQPIVDDGQIAAVRIDDDATLKRFYKNPDGCTLVSMNPQYPPMIFNSDNCDSIQIIGLAVAKYSVIKQ
mgnify:FL=1|jgi:repressor LexA